MPAITLSMFVTQTLGSSPIPGAGLNSISLAGVKKDTSNPAANPGPNDSLFDSKMTMNNPGPALNLNGVTDAVAAFFTKGKKYKVTIEEDIPVAASSPSPDPAPNSEGQAAAPAAN